MNEWVTTLEADLKKAFAGEASGHDWHHIDRVRRLALHLAVLEGADLLVVELAALLHDIADHKFHDHDLSMGPQKAFERVESLCGDQDLARRVATVVAEVSYKGAGVDTPVSTREAAVVQDADRLDAMGAIGIARAFAYGGSKNRLLYDPDQAPVLHDDFEKYARSKGTTVNHFYEKLLLLKDRMNTESARKMAEGRHRFMEEYLERFFAEWEGTNGMG